MAGLSWRSRAAKVAAKLKLSAPFTRHQARWGAQVAAAVGLIMASWSYPPAWNAFSLNSNFINPQLIVIYCCVILIARNMASKPATLLALQLVPSAVLGASLALAVEYITLAANGGHYLDTVTKAAVLLALSSPIAFCLTVQRFSAPGWKFPILFASVVFTLTICGSYRVPGGQLWKFPLYLVMYVSLSGLIAVMASELVTPTPEGLLARRQLATALRSTGELMHAAADLLSGDVDAHGRLVLASGKPQGQLSIDSGLYPHIWPLHQKSSAAGTACHSSTNFVSSARWEVDVYRPTHLFPFVPFFKLSVLMRSLLSATSMLLYPIQSGTLNATVCHHHGDRLMAVALAFEASCKAVAGSLESNEPIGKALQALEQLHNQFLCLGEAAASAPDELRLDPGVLVFTTFFSFFFSAAARLRKLYRVLPAALARDQPTAAAEAQACFERLPDWDAMLLARLELHGQEAGGHDSMAVLRDSIIGGGSSHGGTPRLPGTEAERRTSGELQLLMEGAVHLSGDQKQELLARLSQRTVTAAKPHPPRQRGGHIAWLLRGGRKLLQAARASEQQLRLATQFTFCFVAVMFLQIVGGSYTALEGRSVWAMTVVTVLFEASAGSSIRKGLLRLWGTLAGAAAGLAILGIVVLCSGLSYSNHPQKFILTSVLLALACGLSGAAAARTPSHTYMQITFCITISGVALVGYTQDAAQWTLALWRVAMTVIGIAIQFLAVTCIFPVTSHSILRRQVASALGQLASAAEETIGEICPGQDGEASGHSDTHGSSRGSPGGDPSPRLEIPDEGHVARGCEQDLPSTNCSTATAAAQEAAPDSTDISPFQQVQERSSSMEAIADVEAPPTPDRVEGIAGTAGLPPHHISIRRVQREPSLVVQPLSPAALRGGSRKTMRRAVRQLKAPVGPSVVADCEHLLGPMYTRLLFRAWQANNTISGMAPVITTLRYEWRPFRWQHRIAPAAAFRTQRLCRHLLNVLSSFASSMDAHHITHVRMLAQHSQQVNCVSKQLGECLRGMQAMVQGKVAPDSVAEAAASLQTHVERLFLLALLRGSGGLAADGEEGGGAAGAEAAAFFSMLFSLGWAVRRLALALARAFFGRGSHQERVLEAALGEEQRWSVDDQLLGAAQAVMGLAMAGKPQDAA